VTEVEAADVLEESAVLLVGAGEAALDVIDTEFVELLRDQQLVLEREVEPLALRAVAEGGVVDLDAASGGAHGEARRKRRKSVTVYSLKRRNPATSGRACRSLHLDQTISPTRFFRDE
jgi:hypothetical protein